MAIVLIVHRILFDADDDDEGDCDDHSDMSRSSCFDLYLDKKQKNVFG